MKLQICVQISVVNGPDPLAEGLRLGCTGLSMFMQLTALLANWPG